MTARLCWGSLLLAWMGLAAAVRPKDAPPPWEKPLMAGRSLYLEHCSVCHEINRPGRSRKLGPNLYRLLQNPKLPFSGGKPSREFVATKIKLGGPIMPAFGGRLTDEQVEKLIAFIRSKQ